MKVSIITVNRDDKSGLQKTVESVIYQTFIDYEFIIIDGNSTDGSLDIIEQYKQYISYSVSEPDTGIYNAMNKGIKQAKGEYCYFLNAGDILANKDVLYKVFEENPKTSFICGNFSTRKSGVEEKHSPYKDKDWSMALYEIYSTHLCHQAFFIRTDNFSKYGLYNDSLHIIADWSLFLLAIGVHHQKVLYRDVDIVVYDMEGLSSTIGGKMIYEEKLLAASKILSPPIATKLDRLYYLEQNSYITDNIRKCKILFSLFRIYCKIGRTLGFIKAN